MSFVLCLVPGFKKLISFKVLILFQLLSGFLIEITKGKVEEKILFKMSLTIIYTLLEEGLLLNFQSGKGMKKITLFIPQHHWCCWVSCEDSGSILGSR